MTQQATSPEHQDFGRDPVDVRDTDHYQKEYVHRFVDKWDELIDWDARYQSEGDFFIQLLKERGAKRVLDLGAGYGGSMRFLAREFGCRCVALNLSEVENARDREKNEAQGLGDLIDVVDGDFTNLDYPDKAFDVVWSQDAFLQSGDRERVCAEAARVLNPGGRMIFTDPMQSDAADPKWLQPIYDRIHLDSLGSPEFYRKTLEALGLEERVWEDHGEQLPGHYARVKRELEANEAELRSRGVSDGYIQKMKTGLQHWVDGGRRGDLEWGIFLFRKPA